MSYTREQKSKGGSTTQRLRRQAEARIIELMMEEGVVTIETAALIARCVKESTKELRQHGLALDLSDDELRAIEADAEDMSCDWRLPREERQQAGARASAAQFAVRVREWQRRLDELVKITP